MKLCPYCNGESYREDVCTECGSVFIDRPYVAFTSYDTVKKDKEKLPEPIFNEFSGPLSPDFEYRHSYSTHAKNAELNRALKRQKKKRYKKSEPEFYNRDIMEINRICSALQISHTIKMEALNIRKQVGKIEDYFNRDNAYKCMACIKLACKIHDFPLSNQEFLPLTRGYETEQGSKRVKVKGSIFKKKIDREYLNLLRKTKLRIRRFPVSPNYIPYICNKLGLGIELETGIRKKYQQNLKYYKSQYSMEGYVLALIYLLYGRKHKIHLTKLESISGVSRTTISARIRDIKRIWSREK